MIRNPNIFLINFLFDNRIIFNKKYIRMPADPAFIFQLIEGLWKSQLVYTGVSLGVFEHLSLSEGRDAEQLSSEIKAHAGTLYRLLRALSNIGLLEETEDHKFKLTENGAVLREDHPTSLRDAALFEQCPQFNLCWNRLPEVVTGGPGKYAFELEFGKPFFNYLEGNPKYASVFNNAMTFFSKQVTPGVVSAVKKSNYLKDAQVICDVGGGLGYMLNEILKEAANPTAKGLVAELPIVVQEIKAKGGNPDFAKNLEYVEIDMFKEAVPADVYFLKEIFHDWPDKECIQILLNIRKVAKPGAKFIGVEAVIPKPGDTSFSKLLDVHMMLVCNGGQRTEEEFKQLYEAAGWKFEGATLTENSMVSLVVGSL